jgi:hypothetical protein
MGDWKSHLNADPIDWLLEKDNPSVRYFAFTGLLGCSENDSRVKEAKKAIMEIGPVPKILSKEKDGGYWGKPEDFYIHSKYKGTVWSLILLAELGANGRDERVKKACEFILENSQDRESGGFAHRGTASNGGQHSSVIPCLTGNMVFSLIRLGYLDDRRVQKGIDWIVSCQRFDDKVKTAPKGWPYDRFPRCWGTHTCHMGVVKALKALAKIPVEKRSEGVKNTIEKGAEYMLVHHIYKRSHNLSKVSKPEWLKFGFPTMWKTDALEILEILARLGYKDERMKDAVDLVLSKQDSQGRWKLENTFNGRMQVNIEEKDKPSKWITLNALKALKAFYS